MSFAHIAGLVLELLVAGIVGVLLDRTLGNAALTVWLIVCLTGLGWLHWGEIRPLLSKKQPSPVAQFQSSPREPPHGDIPPPPGGWLPEWGAPIPPLGVRSIVNVSTFIPYHKPFHLMLIYRVDDKLVDEQEDTNIARSAIFTVADDPRLTIDVQLSQDFMKQSGPQKAGNMRLGMRVALLALPSTVKADEITRISDAKRFGGEVLVIAGFPYPIKAIKWPH